MAEERTPEPQPRLVWPRIAIAAVALGVMLAIVWMTAAVRKIQDGKNFATGVPSSPNSPLTSAPPLKATNEILANPLLTGGNAERGRKLFFEKPEANCAKCHRVGQTGGDLGPALDGIGSRETRQALLDSMLKPNARIIEGYDSVVLLLTNKTGVSGILKRETDLQLHILTPEDGLLSIDKSSIEIRQRGLSPMPEGLDQVLSAQDLSDLVEYLASLR